MTRNHLVLDDSPGCDEPQPSKGASQVGRTHLSSGTSITTRLHSRSRLDSIASDAQVRRLRTSTELLIVVARNYGLREHFRPRQCPIPVLLVATTVY